MEPMETPRRQGLEPRLVFALVLIAIPVLIGVAQLILVRSGGECGDPDRSQVGGVTQLFVPGNGCAVEPKPRTP